jgi:hypothetical protein
MLLITIEQEFMWLINLELVKLTKISMMQLTHFIVEQALLLALPLIGLIHFTTIQRASITLIAIVLIITVNPCIALILPNSYITFALILLSFHHTVHCNFNHHDSQHLAYGFDSRKYSYFSFLLQSF